jgi:hypothetical protein
VIVVEGRMVERLHFATAQRTMQIAEQIAALEEEMKIAALPPEPEILPA